MSGKAVDYVVPNGISLEAAKANGYGGGVRYLGGWGRLLPDERDHFRALGLWVGLVWEQNIGDALQGAALGEAQARQAVAEANSLFPGGGGVVFMACDTDPRRNRAGTVDYYRAAAPIIRASNNAAGGYVGDDPGVQLLDERTLDVLWQPGASSWSVTFPNPRAHLVQTVGQPANLGGDYDHNDVIIGFPAWGATETGGFLMALSEDEQREILDGVRALHNGYPQFGILPAAPTISLLHHDLAGVLSLVNGKPSSRALLEAAAAAPAGDGSDADERQRLAEVRDALRAKADELDAFLGQ